MLSKYITKVHEQLHFAEIKSYRLKVLVRNPNNAKD